MNKTYFVTLTPYQLYFFGREQEVVADYYLKGNPLPQQTALLGMVRYQILKQNDFLYHNNLIPKKKDEACKWIGCGSFQYDKNLEFGKILSLSPCHLVKIDNDDTKKYLPTYPEFFHDLKKIGDNYFLPFYDPKKDYALRWRNTKNQNDILEDNFYEEVERVGVNKNYKGKTEEDSFYKQVWFKMKKGYAFGFYLTLSDDKVTFQDADVNLGKENTIFHMKVMEEDLPEEIYHPEDNAVVLTCDAFIDPKSIDDCSFAVCDNVPFRNLCNTTDPTHNHYGLNKSSKRIQLLKRGSVFIPNGSVFIPNNNMNKFINALKNETNFRNIGYNAFQTFKLNIL
ncbi:MAG TPA: type III-B CRISPR module-associated Cmr3 family protein [Paludibacteraceae bacterium]|nr:type III-B CRISPR module-associated Cmr3 family protein [Paludibacteraceae bacterium]